MIGRETLGRAGLVPEGAVIVRALHAVHAKGGAEGGAAGLAVLGADRGTAGLAGRLHMSREGDLGDLEPVEVHGHTMGSKSNHQALALLIYHSQSMSEVLSLLSGLCQVLMEIGWRAHLSVLRILSGVSFLSNAFCFISCLRRPSSDPLVTDIISHWLNHHACRWFFIIIFRWPQ